MFILKSFCEFTIPEGRSVVLGVSIGVQIGHSMDNHKLQEISLFTFSICEGTYYLTQK